MVKKTNQVGNENAGADVSIETLSINEVSHDSVNLNKSLEANANAQAQVTSSHQKEIAKGVSVNEESNASAREILAVHVPSY